MSKKVELSTQETIHLAKLANLQLSEPEIEKFKTQLSETLEYVENLHELDTNKVFPTNHVTDLKDIFFEDGTVSTRTLTKEEVLANTTEKKGKFFVVKRIM
jgi:aspartyl/glutamyl-tRNA(Asn/Gln) amidotransferase C subunit